jgi:voltage-gated potassium channel
VTADASTPTDGAQGAPEAEGSSQEASESSTYELFIGALSVLSVFNLILVLIAPERALSQIAYQMDALLSSIFLLDFAARLWQAPSRSGYFFRGFGWMDLLSSLPFPQFKILRTFRIVRVARLVRRYGARGLLRDFIANRAGSALLTLLLLIILVLEFGGWGIYRVEAPAPGANITTPGDALWYTYVTITTVGYGDKYPVTLPGRIIGAIIMTAGVGLFGALAGYLANAFLAPPKPTETAASDAPAEGSSTTEASATSAESTIVELKRLAASARDTQASLETKIAELETQLATPTA